MATHKTGTTKPDFVTWGVEKMRKYYRVNVNITGSDQSWQWDEIVTPLGSMDYGFLTSQIIRIKYSEDQMEAIINNILKDKDNPDYIQAFTEMQEYRDESKQMAKDARQWATEAGIWDPSTEADPEQPEEELE